MAKVHSDKLTCSWNNTLKFCFTPEEIECIFKTYKMFFNKELESLGDLKELHYLLHDEKFTNLLKSSCSKLYEAIRYQSLKPSFKTSESGWLDEENINDVMKQYTKDLSFSWLGTLAIDEIPTVWPQTRFAAIVNLSKRNEPGSHWVAVLRAKRYLPIEHFDPVGDDTKFRLGLNAYVHRKKHQNDDSNCGVYSIYYILSRFNDVPLKNFEKEDITEEQMEDFFDKLFITYS